MDPIALEPVDVLTVTTLVDNARSFRTRVPPSGTPWQPDSGLMYPSRCRRRG